MRRLSWTIPILIACASDQAATLDHIRLRADGSGFEHESSGTRFTPVGFNYDHNEKGQLLEDYWALNWGDVEEDFREMKALGANLVRIHLQFAKFMTTRDSPSPDALTRLTRLLRLAEETGLYLDVTGLGCYHKADVPAWYDALSEAERWAAQATFWEAIAACCKDSPAVFCYDLMNEPVVAGGKKPRTDWLGRDLNGKHFVQFITRDAHGRPLHEAARAWIGQLVDAIRKHDARHLVTVGMVHWSLKQPGKLYSGFAPDLVSDQLDFIAVHIYPKKGEGAEALETLQAFDVGKPILIEETAPLKCGVPEWEAFVDASKRIAEGWVGFYWGTSAQEYRAMGGLQNNIRANWLDSFARTMAKLSGAR